LKISSRLSTILKISLSAPPLFPVSYNVDLDKVTAREAVQMIAEWLDGNEIENLNVAGPRASKDPGIHDFVVGILNRVWEV